MRVTFSLVGEDRRDRWTNQMLNAVLAIRHFGGALADAPVVVTVIDHVRPKLRAALEDLGASVRVRPAVHEEYRYANKIRLLELDDAATADVIVGIDVDVLVLGDISGLLDPSAVGFRIATNDGWSEELWARLFERFGVVPPSERVTLLRGGRSFRYGNTGVISVPWTLRRPLADRWMHFVHELWQVADEEPDWLPQKFLTDQYAFAFALFDLDLPVRPLPPSLNFNFNWTERFLRPDVTAGLGPPFVYHYHSKMEPDGAIRPPRWDRPDLVDAIASFNALRRTVAHPDPTIGARLPPWLARSTAYRGASHVWRRTKQRVRA